MRNDLATKTRGIQKSGASGAEGRSLLLLGISTFAGTVALCTAAYAQNALLDPLLNPTLNATQINMTDVITTACPSGTNEAGFQARCDALIGFAKSKRQSTPRGLVWRANVSNTLQQVSPEQIIGQGTQATKTSVSVLGARLAALRLGARGLRVAGLNLDGQPAVGGPLAGLGSGAETGGAAGDPSSSVSNRLGAFVNGIYNFGNVDTTFNQVGFDFDSGGVTAGMDYRFTDALILGGAFTYLRMESDFDRNGGELNSDTYNGSIYGSFYPTGNFYVDGIFTIGGIDYDSLRQIDYTLPGVESVNTQAKAKPGGMQYSASVAGGYNYVLGQLTVDPYVRVNYLNLDVDGFREQGGNGWAMQFSDQTVESVTSTLGTRLSYALSVPWGVLRPYIRGEWRHEFEDEGRIIPVRFLGDTTSGLAFSTVTDSPDRDYFNVGTGISTVLANNVSAFVSYDALLGYKDIESHSFMVGARVTF